MRILVFFILVLLPFFSWSQKNVLPKNGTAKIYFPSESKSKQLKETGLMKNSVRTDLWHFYHENGKLYYTIFYDQDTSIQTKNTFLGEKIISKEHFFNRTLHGKQQYFNQRSEPIVTYYYSHGKPDSLIIYHNGSDKIKSRKSFHANSELKDLYLYFSTGELSEKKSYNDQKQADGIWLTYSRNWTGKHFILWETPYFNGKIQGLLKKFDENGLLESAEFDQDQKHGSYRSYHQNGQLEYALEYEHGAKKGKGTYFNEDGIKLRDEYWAGSAGTFYYQTDIYDSLFTYFPNGKVKIKSFQVFLNSNQIKTNHISYFSNGNLQSVSEKLNVESNGLWEEFYVNGKKKYQIPFKKGLIDGKTTFWYPNGQKKLELDVKENHVLMQKGWNEQGKILGIKSDAYKDLFESENRYQLMNDALYEYEPMEELVRSEEYPVLVNDIAAEFTENSTKKPSHKQNRVDVNAEFPGGRMAFNQFIKSNVHIPTAEKTFAQSKSFEIEIQIDVDGTAELVFIRPIYSNPSDLDVLFETEIRRMLTHSPLWTPAQRNNQFVPHIQVFTVQF